MSPHNDTSIRADLRTLARVATWLWLTAIGVQFVIWALILLISGDWSEPWWLWTVTVGGGVVGVVLVLERRYRTREPRSTVHNGREMSGS